jgi:hypothetical protein
MSNKLARRSALSNLTRLNATRPNRLAMLKQREEWNRLPAAVRLSYEASEAQVNYLLEVLDQHFAGVGEARVETQEAIRATRAAWLAMIAELGPEAAEAELKAAICALENEQASIYEAHERALRSLQQLHAQRTEEALARPDHEWVEETWQDRLNDLLTLGEDRLKRAGHPPLTLGESFLNALTLGLMAEKRYRDQEQARIAGTTTGNGHEEIEEGVIDVQFTPR